jgi:hypothetical protein
LLDELELRGHVGGAGAKRRPLQKAAATTERAIATLAGAC